MVQSTGAWFCRAISEIIAESGCAIAGVADEVNGAVLRLVFAEIEPSTRKIEGRAKSKPKAQDTHIERGRRFKVRCANRIMAELP